MLPTKQHSQSVSVTHQGGKANIHELPNEAQRHGALDAVLKNKYLHLVPALLKEYMINLNFELSFTPQTPLEHITELEDVKIVELLLNNGADANISIKICYTLGGRPLLYAVQQENHKLVEILVQKTNRAACTRALGHAITKRDISIIHILLANGVKCDFEDSDRPLSSMMSRDHGGFPTWPTYFRTCGDQSELAEYTPPLIRAVILGDENLVRLLLAHGADVNIGFHDLDVLLLPSAWPIDISCGRPIQLAMELDHHNIVQLLFDNNADINLAQPVLQNHSCEMIPRMAYHQIITRLRSMAVSITAAK
jgi:serum/glucocorticoid-regulated kinase 2